MKKPRIEDFDPNAKLPELGSPLDHMPEIKKPNHSSHPNGKQEQSLGTQEEPSVSQPVRPPVRTYARTPVRRQVTRYAFEFFQDQVDELRRLSLEDKLQGGKGSMSEMVREAIDDYLAKKKPLDG